MPPDPPRHAKHTHMPAPSTELPPKYSILDKTLTSGFEPRLEIWKEEGNQMLTFQNLVSITCLVCGRNERNETC